MQYDDKEGLHLYSLVLCPSSDGGVLSTGAVSWASQRGYDDWQSVPEKTERQDAQKKAGI